MKNYSNKMEPRELDVLEYQGINHHRGATVSNDAEKLNWLLNLTT